MTSDAVRELEEKNEALRTRIVTAHAERDSALALVHARTVNLDAMRTDRDAAVKRAEDAEAKLAAVREALVGIDVDMIRVDLGKSEWDDILDAIEAARKACE